MREMVKNKSKNDGYLLDAFQHESYSKIEIDIDKMSQKFLEKKKRFGKFLINWIAITD